ncbi:MAG: preprotein translocase subunit YajC [Lachnospiraceae bacterium]|nr:preprotein translocase subunit YajC [Lachnospiraceae bacterium]
MLAAAAGGAGNGTILMVVYIVIIGAFFYFAIMRPQKKEKNRMQSMLESLEVGDSVLTNSGFYGMVIDIADDMVIVEFGNNKNCRIPMQKAAIAQIEKPGQSQAAAPSKDEKKEKTEKK